MLTRTECDVRFASHRRQINRVNERAWMRPRRPQAVGSFVRAMVGARLMALGARIAPSPADAAGDFVLLSDQAL